MADKNNYPVIVAAKRTPVGRFLGGLTRVPSPQLGAFAIEAALKESRIDPASVDECIMGCVCGVGPGFNLECIFGIRPVCVMGCFFGVRPGCVLECFFGIRPGCVMGCFFGRSDEHMPELPSQAYLVCCPLLEPKTHLLLT